MIGPIRAGGKSRKFDGHDLRIAVRCPDSLAFDHRRGDADHLPLAVALLVDRDPGRLEHDLLLGLALDRNTARLDVNTHPGRQPIGAYPDVWRLEVIPDGVADRGEVAREACLDL